jgi:carbon storage regulator
MLILARRPGERVVIGDEILVTVMAVSGSTVRLGIEAPRGVSVYREEIWLAVKEENRAAAEAAADALPDSLVPAASPEDPAPIPEDPATALSEGSATKSPEDQAPAPPEDQATKSPEDAAE